MPHGTDSCSHEITRKGFFCRSNAKWRTTHHQATCSDLLRILSLSGLKASGNIKFEQYRNNPLSSNKFFVSLILKLVKFFPVVTEHTREATMNKLIVSSLPHSDFRLDLTSLGQPGARVRARLGQERKVELWSDGLFYMFY